jgi:hypothetical protein
MSALNALVALYRNVRIGRLTACKKTKKALPESLGVFLELPASADVTQNPKAILLAELRQIAGTNPRHRRACKACFSV